MAWTSELRVAASTADVVMEGWKHRPGCVGLASREFSHSLSLSLYGHASRPWGLSHGRPRQIDVPALSGLRMGCKGASDPTAPAAGSEAPGAAVPVSESRRMRRSDWTAARSAQGGGVSRRMCHCLRNAPSLHTLTAAAHGALLRRDAELLRAVAAHAHVAAGQHGRVAWLGQADDALGAGAEQVAPRGCRGGASAGLCARRRRLAVTVCEIATKKVGEMLEVHTHGIELILFPTHRYQISPAARTPCYQRGFSA